MVDACSKPSWCAFPYPDEDDPYDDAAVLPVVPSALASVPSSIPVHTVQVGALTFTVIRVEVRGRVTHQLYAVDRSWTLVGIFGLFVDCLAEIATWRRYLAGDGTLAAWVAAHPDGVTVTPGRRS
jgi:hypothetical protein